MDTPEIFFQKFLNLIRASHNEALIYYKMDRGKINKFLEYFSKQLSFEQVNYLNTINNIKQEKVG